MREWPSPETTRGGDNHSRTLRAALAQYALGEDGTGGVEDVPVERVVQTLEDGAWTDNLGVALWALERGRLVSGERVAVVGPGAIGLCAAQLARALGASEIVIVGRGERLARANAFASRRAFSPNRSRS